ncbi:DUF3995 domain-containing protein [Microbacterium sp. NPDC057944]|uniref:DUF3995 domain-containing protein n=1 Tax=Microbacterium sp. NPDC057944 TaxID=3346286 RepID=UPI0036DA5783
MSVIRGAARLVSWTGLTAVGGLHLIWASGSSWPAKNRRRLASATVGNAAAMPDAAATAVVAGAALAGGAVSAGALGEGRMAVVVRRLIATALLARAIVGGEVALKALGLPPADKRFRELDKRYYRPLCAVLGIATLIGSRRSRR